MKSKVVKDMKHAVAILTQWNGAKAPFLDTVNEVEYAAGNLADHYQIQLLTDFQSLYNCKLFIQNLKQNNNGKRDSTTR